MFDILKRSNQQYRHPVIGNAKPQDPVDAWILMNALHYQDDVYQCKFG